MRAEREAKAAQRLAEDHKLYGEILSRHPYWRTDNDPPDLDVTTTGFQRIWRKNGVMHRDGAPALVGFCGAWQEKWFQNGKLHRTDGPAKTVMPASEYPEWWIAAGYGYKKWFVNGHLHREDGPAVIMRDGEKRWYQNGKLHRTDGPAIERRDGGFEYWVQGVPHRAGLPAVVYAQKRFETFYTDTPLEAWYEKGRLHREDGPAITFKDTEIWMRYGKFHRLDGPAVQVGHARGAEYFFYKLRYSRAYGQRRKFTPGATEFWIYGRRYTAEAFQKHLDKMKVLKG